MPEDNNQEFDAASAEAALGSINTTPSCEILEHPQLRNLKRPPERTKKLEFMVYGYIRRTKGIVGLQLLSLENDTWSFAMFYNQDFDWPIQSSHIIEGIKCSITTQRDGPWNYLPD